MNWTMPWDNGSRHIMCFRRSSWFCQNHHPSRHNGERLNQVKARICERKADFTHSMSQAILAFLPTFYEITSLWKLLHLRNPRKAFVRALPSGKCVQRRFGPARRRGKTVHWGAPRRLHSRWAYTTTWRRSLYPLRSVQQ
jgi:hypothetical protein